MRFRQRNSTKIIFAMWILLLYIVGSIYFENKDVIKKIHLNESRNIKVLFEIYKRKNILQSVLVENENYVDVSEYVNEYKKSTPLFSSRDSKINPKYNFSFKYFSSDDVFLGKKVREMFYSLGYLQYIISTNESSIELLGKLNDNGYVLISKDISTVREITEKLNYCFIQIVFFMFIFLAIVFYLYKESLLYKNRKKELEIEYKILEIEAKELAFIDSLTNIDSRLKFSISLSELIETTKRFENSFCLILFDVDDFKKVNDNYGHDYGDIVLKSIASCVKNSIRKYDVFARWGGEEFVLLLPITSYEDGILFAQKIRKKISELKYEKTKQVTCSFGVIDYLQGDDENSMLKRVDTFLYKAKKFGKNCIKYEDR